MAELRTQRAPHRAGRSGASEYCRARPEARSNRSNGDSGDGTLAATGAISTPRQRPEINAMTALAGTVPILTCDEARALETKLFGGDETREWSAMQCAG